jgi:hypothetical protein
VGAIAGSLKEETMKMNEKKHELSGQVTRRALIRNAAATAVMFSTGALGQGAPQAAGVEYGEGKTELKPETIFPLFAAWLLLTTDPPFAIDEELLSCAARLHPNTAKTIKGICDRNANVLKPARKVFKELASTLSGASGFYSGGQCPKVADTVTPVAGLLGTPTTVACKRTKPLSETQ